MTYQNASSTSAWAALGDPTRRAIFERLLDQPQAVHALANDLPVSRPAVSQHLKVLSEAGLVVARREGKQRIYEVDPNGIAALRAELQRFWDKTLVAYKAVVEQTSTETPREE
jgi:DNA-binding transcriptional ArsR family regulator